MTPIEVEAYTDDYGNRLALRYPYSPETNAILKDVLPFPQFKWDADKRVWSVEDNQVTINKAIEVLERMDYNCTALISRTKQLPETTRGNSECWTRLSEGLLYLHWPYIPDNAFRDKVASSTRSRSAGRFHLHKRVHYTLFLRMCTLALPTPSSTTKMSRKMSKEALSV